MNKFKKSQVLLFFVLLLILAIIPLPSSLRPTYLYFILNLIIIALSAEAGLFSVSICPVEDRKQYPSFIQDPVIPSEASSERMKLSIASGHVEKKVIKGVEESEPERVVSVINVQKGPLKSSLFFIGKPHLRDRKQYPSFIQDPVIPSEASSERMEPSIATGHVEKKVIKGVEKSEPERVVSVIKVQKGPLKSSLFFIGNGEADEEIMDEETEAEEEESETEGVNGQELFAKAEVFIGNFYKQLKMQKREQSWIY